MEEKRLTITEHLEELRKRLIISLVALAIATIIAFPFTPLVFQILTRPAPGIKPIYIEVTEMLGTYFKVAIITGLALAMPVILYQVVMFVAPGLTRSEKRYLYLLLPGVILSFIIGVLFGYFVLLPPAIGFLLTFGSDIATPQIRIGNYVSTVTTLLLWLGLSFETPIIIYFLARIGLITPKMLAGGRRFAVVGAFILGAVITPTFDPVNQSLVAFPLILLYELGIWLAKLAWRGRPYPHPTRVPAP